MSLASQREQTTAIRLVVNPDGRWQADFPLIGQATGHVLLAEFRSLTDGVLQLVALGEVPDLVQALQVAITSATWSAETAEIRLTLSVTNPTAGAIYMDTPFIQIPTIGGDGYATLGRVTPNLPLLILPNSTVLLTVSVTHLTTEKTQIQIGGQMWEIGQPASGSVP